MKLLPILLLLCAGLVAGYYWPSGGSGSANGQSDSASESVQRISGSVREGGRHRTTLAEPLGNTDAETVTQLERDPGDDSSRNRNGPASREVQPVADAKSPASPEQRKDAAERIAAHYTEVLHGYWNERFRSLLKELDGVAGESQRQGRELASIMLDEKLQTMLAESEALEKYVLSASAESLSAAKTAKDRRKSAKVGVFSYGPEAGSIWGGATRVDVHYCLKYKDYPKLERAINRYRRARVNWKNFLIRTKR